MAYAYDGYDSDYSDSGDEYTEEYYSSDSEDWTYGSSDTDSDWEEEEEEEDDEYYEYDEDDDYDEYESE